MSDYELYHFGVKGMKWGVRKKNRYERTHNHDGSLNERGQRAVYKKLKKGKLHEDAMDAFNDQKYKEAMATRKAAGDLGIYLTEHGRSSELSKRMNKRAWKNLDIADSDWDKADDYITSVNKKLADDLLGKYKDKKIGEITASRELAYEGEAFVSSLMNDYGEMIPHYAKYFE